MEKRKKFRSSKRIFFLLSLLPQIFIIVVEVTLYCAYDDRTTRGGHNVTMPTSLSAILVVRRGEDPFFFCFGRELGTEETFLITLCIGKKGLLKGIFNEFQL